MGARDRSGARERQPFIVSGRLRAALGMNTRDSCERFALWFASACVALTRIPALSRSLWDWDEALFCFAMQDYDVAAYRPHPPGFPLFVAAARVARTLLSLSDF